MDRSCAPTNQLEVARQHSHMSTSTNTLPRGAAFFDIVATVEAQCSTESIREIPKLGLSTPACFDCLGDVLSLLYAEASCFHGCLGGDHFYQRITARIVTHSLSSLRLALLGYYDESFAVTRNLGEMANLLFLFAARPDLVETWRSADDAARWKEFGPAKVRRALEEMNLRPPVDKSRYGLLCEVGVHLVPSVSPQTFNEHGRSTLGARFQYKGLMCALNELATAVAECAGCVSVFPHVEDRRESLQTAAQALLNVVGHLDLKVARDKNNET
jgi:hypothetical protein